MKKIIIAILTLLILHKPSLIRSEINPPTEEEIKVKIQLLKNGNDGYRYKPFTIYHSAQRYYEKDNPEAVAREIIKIGEKAVQPLIEALKDENDDIRCWSAYILGEIGNKSAVKPLLSALNDKSECVVADSIMSLGKLDAKEGKSIVLKKVNDESPYVRGNTLYYFGKIKDKTATDIVIKGLHDDTCYVEWRAALALGQIKDNKAFEPLKKLLLQKSKTTPKECVLDESKIYEELLLPYKWAIWSIGELRNKEGVGVLASIHPSINEALEDELYTAYLKIGSFYNTRKTLSSKESQLLLENMRNDIVKEIGSCDEIRFEYSCDSYYLTFNAILREKIFNFLGSQLILENLKTNDDEIKTNVTRILSYLDEDENYLSNLLNDDNPDVRAMALLNFRTSFNNNNLKYIYEALNDENPQIKINAIDAIFYYRCPSDAKKIITLFKDKNIDVRKKAVETVGYLNPIQNSDSLLEMLKDKDKSVRDAAVNAFKYTKLKEVIPILENLLGDETHYDQTLLIDVLSEIGSLKVLPYLRTELKDKNEIYGWGTIIEKLKSMSSYLASDRDLVRKNFNEIFSRDDEYTSFGLYMYYLIEDVDKLISVIEDANSEPYLISESVYYLGLLKDEKAMNPICKILNSPSLEVRENALNALMQLNNNKCIPYVIPLLNDQSNIIKASAISLIGILGSKENEQIIAEFLENSDSDLRCNAAGALCNIGTEAVLQKLKDSEHSNCYLAKIAINNILKKSKAEY